jgi:outer membrane cobalamin receptor
MSVSYQLTETIALKSNLNTGFRYPTFDELYLSKGIFVGNLDLKPEETFGGDVGAEYKDKYISVLGSYFLYRTKNLIEYLLVSGFQYKPFNYSQALTEGVELSVKVRPLTWLQFYTQWTYQNVVNKEEGSDYFDQIVPGRPHLYGTHGVEIHPWNELTFFSDVSLATDRYLNKANTKKLIDRYEWNAGVKWEIDPSLSAAVETRNLLNRNNIDVRGFPLPGRIYYATLTKAF